MAARALKRAVAVAVNAITSDEDGATREATQRQK